MIGKGLIFIVYYQLINNHFIFNIFISACLEAIAAPDRSCYHPI